MDIPRNRTIVTTVEDRMVLAMVPTLLSTIRRHILKLSPNYRRITLEIAIAGHRRRLIQTVPRNTSLQNLLLMRRRLHTATRSHLLTQVDNIVILVTAKDNNSFQVANSSPTVALSQIKNLIVDSFKGRLVEDPTKVAESDLDPLNFILSVLEMLLGP